MPREHEPPKGDKLSSRERAAERQRRREQKSHDPDHESGAFELEAQDSQREQEEHTETRRESQTAERPFDFPQASEQESGGPSLEELKEQSRRLSGSADVNDWHAKNSVDAQIIRQELGAKKVDEKKGSGKPAAEKGAGIPSASSAARSIADKEAAVTETQGKGEHRQPEFRLPSEMTMDELQGESARLQRYYRDPALLTRKQAIDSRIQAMRGIPDSAKSKIPDRRAEASETGKSKKQDPKGPPMVRDAKSAEDQIRRHRAAIERAKSDLEQAEKTGYPTRFFKSRLKRHTDALQKLEGAGNTPSETRVDSASEAITPSAPQEELTWENYAKSVEDSLDALKKGARRKSEHAEAAQQEADAAGGADEKPETQEDKSASAWQEYIRQAEDSFETMKASGAEQGTKESRFQDQLRRRDALLGDEDLLHHIQELEERAAYYQSQTQALTNSPLTRSQYTQRLHDVRGELAVANDIAIERGLRAEQTDAVKEPEAAQPEAAAEEDPAQGNKESREQNDEQKIQSWLTALGEDKMQGALRTEDEQRVLRAFQEASQQGRASALLEKPEIWGVLRTAASRKAVDEEGNLNTKQAEVAEMLSVASRKYIERGGQYGSPWSEGLIAARVAALRSADEAIEIVHSLQKRMDDANDEVSETPESSVRVPASLMLQRSTVDMLEAMIASERSSLDLADINKAVESRALPRRDRLAEEEMTFEERVRFMARYLGILHGMNTGAPERGAEAPDAEQGDEAETEKQAESESLESLQRKVGIARTAFAGRLTSQSRLAGRGSEQELLEAEGAYREAVETLTQHNIELLQSDFAKLDVSLPEHRIEFQTRLVEFLLNDRLREEQALRESMRDTAESSAARKFGLAMRKHAKTRLVISTALTAGTAAALSMGNLPAAAAMRAAKGVVTGVGATSALESLMRSIESAKATKELSLSDISAMDDYALERELLRHESRYIEYGEGQYGVQQRGIRKKRTDNTGLYLLREYIDRKRKSYMDDAARLLREGGDPASVIDRMLLYQAQASKYRHEDQLKERLQQRKRNIARWTTSSVLGAATGMLSGVGVGKLLHYADTSPAAEHASQVQPSKESLHDIAERVAREPALADSGEAAPIAESETTAPDFVGEGPEPVDTLDIAPQEQEAQSPEPDVPQEPKEPASADSAKVSENTFPLSEQIPDTVAVEAQHSDLKPSILQSADVTEPVTVQNSEVPVVTEPEKVPLIELTEKGIKAHTAIQKTSDALYSQSPAQAESLMGAFRKVAAVDAAKGKAFGSILKEQGVDKNPLAKELAAQMKELFKQFPKDSLNPDETVYDVLRRLARPGK